MSDFAILRERQRTLCPLFTLQGWRSEGRGAGGSVRSPSEPAGPESCPTPHWPGAPGEGKGNSGAASKAPSGSSDNLVTSRVLLLADTSMEPDREPPSSSRRRQTCGQQVQAPLQTHHYSAPRPHLPHQVTGRQDETGLADSVSSRATLASVMECRCPLLPTGCLDPLPAALWGSRGPGQESDSSLVLYLEAF